MTLSLVGEALLRGWTTSSSPSLLTSLILPSPSGHCSNLFWPVCFSPNATTLRMSSQMLSLHWTSFSKSSSFLLPPKAPALASCVANGWFCKQLFDKWFFEHPNSCKPKRVLSSETLVNLASLRNCPCCGACLLQPAFDQPLLRFFIFYAALTSSSLLQLLWPHILLCYLFFFPARACTIRSIKMQSVEVLFDALQHSNQSTQLL